ncbi:MAG TPA: LuxR C-terminal-related transcriptional regulator [Thermomicrobiaceae bacterium]|nr:LuxR C-terminal-related transcriptional regulator [Thermomicrobiaceae bacterium]
MDRQAPRPPGVIPITSHPASQPYALELPEPLTHLFGREADLAGLHDLLASGARLITLTGPPGIGKTRLALEAARAWSAAGGRDARFISLAAIDDPSLVLPTIAHGLAVQANGRAALLDRIAVATRDGPLLVLDNFEQVTVAALDVLELLNRAPLLTLLITSRARLRLGGEREWPVRSLALPRPATPPSLAALRATPALALLLDRARALQPDFALTETNATALAAICHRLEGIPLALELAAPWLRLFSPETLLERLDQRLSLLRGGAHDLPPRQQALADAIAWSDNLLSPAERLVFHQLAVFVDGWTLEAAEAVCGREQPAGGVLTALAALLDKSLILRTSEPEGTPRFGMLEMVRDYAAQELAAAPDADEIARRHAMHLATFAQEARPHLFGPDQPAWLGRLEHELGNLRAALRWLIDHGRRDDGLRLAADLENFWLVHDHLEEGQRWLEAALALNEPAAPENLARARRALAVLMLRRGDYDRARSLYQVNLVFARERDDRRLVAQTLLDLGTLDGIGGDLTRAAAHFQDAVALGRQVDDRRTVARALNQLGELARHRGDDASAAAFYAESLALWRVLAEQERIAMVLHNLGPVVHRLGDRARANALLTESLDLSWQLRNRHGAAICLIGIAGACGAGWSESTRAARLLGAADAFRASIGVQWEPVDQSEYDRSLATVRARLDEIAFDEAYRQGRNLTLAAAVELARRMLDEAAADTRASAGRAPDARRPPGGLTRREYEVIQHLALGQTNREIAASLSIAEKTVEMHVSNALHRLGLRSRTQLAAWLATRGERPS